MPIKREPNARRRIVAVRFNEAEYRAVEVYAKAKGLPPTTSIHETMLKVLEQEGFSTSVEAHDPNQLTIV